MSLSRQQFTLLGIFALFLGPVLLVIMMRSSWWQYQPGSLKNHGLLVQPPVQLSFDQAQPIDGKWVVLYVLDNPCGDKCLENVTALRQIHRAAGRNSTHINIALLSDVQTEPALRSKLEAIYPKFDFLIDSRQTALTTLETINADLAMDLADIHTYILDPMLHVILAYHSDANPIDIHKDLKRLLKWSNQEGN